mmetsp:Transcript_35974/g.32358  ORF Transcript_35974/g.32358 Transcript_35974/m.32358 type:complete len:211 (+) Transcript_35974:164-796(+)
MPNQQYPQQYPQQGMQGPPQAYYPNPQDWNAMNQLAHLQGLFVKQKPQYLENIWDRNNVYYIYRQNAQTGDKLGPKMFKAKENSSCCSRQCLHPSCRPFKVNVEHEDGPFVGSPAFRYERDCRFTFCCCNRPEMDVFYTENGANDKIGKVTEPWYCCDRGIRVFDKKGEHIYEIIGNCCQLGFCCQCPCDACQTIDFEIRNKKGDKISAL